MSKQELLQQAKPILFNTEMVRAILDGRKTVTRRIVKAPVLYEIDEDPNRIEWLKWDGLKIANFVWNGKAIGGFKKKPPYQPCEILYVRETWTKDGEKYYYRADFESDYLDPCETLSGGYPYSCRFGCENCRATSYRIKWHPSIHMPKEAARIFLRVTDVRVERLQDITEDQAGKEGCIDSRGFIWSPDNEYNNPHTAKEDFMKIWDSTIKKQDLDKYGWDANPWAWVVEFERLEAD